MRIAPLSLTIALLLGSLAHAEGPLPLEVAHFRVRRHGEQTADFFRRRQTLRVLPCVGQALRHQSGEFRFHIHKAHNSLYAMLRFPTAIIPYFRPRRKGSSQSSNGT